jgi:hypothetical protein
MASERDGQLAVVVTLASLLLNTSSESARDRDRIAPLPVIAMSSPVATRLRQRNLGISAP